MAKDEGDQETSTDDDTPTRPSALGHATFIVRTSETETGRVVGVVEHVKTGRKERFDGIEAISGAIAALMRLVPKP